MTPETMPLNDQWVLLLEGIADMIPSVLAEEGNTVTSLTIALAGDGWLRGVGKACDDDGNPLDDLHFTVGHVTVTA